MRTELCDLLGIQYPIILAPMAWIGTAELAASVSEAGGLGTIGPSSGMKQQRESTNMEASIERFKEQVNKVRSLTCMPFAANIPSSHGNVRNRGKLTCYAYDFYMTCAIELTKEDILYL